MEGSHTINGEEHSLVAVTCLLTSHHWACIIEYTSPLSLESETALFTGRLYQTHSWTISKLRRVGIYRSTVSIEACNTFSDNFSVIKSILLAPQALMY